MIGKLYVLSMFYMVYVASISSTFRSFLMSLSSNAQPPQRDGQHPTFISTLTIPMDVLNTHTRDPRVGDDASCSEAVVEEYGTTKTVGFAV